MEATATLMSDAAGYVDPDSIPLFQRIWMWLQENPTLLAVLLIAALVLLWKIDRGSIGFGFGTGHREPLKPRIPSSWTCEQRGSCLRVYDDAGIYIGSLEYHDRGVNK
jgi:hypothetical protein